MKCFWCSQPIERDPVYGNWYHADPIASGPEIRMHGCLAWASPVDNTKDIPFGPMPHKEPYFP